MATQFGYNLSAEVLFAHLAAQNKNHKSQYNVLVESANTKDRFKDLSILSEHLTKAQAAGLENTDLKGIKNVIDRVRKAADVTLFDKNESGVWDSSSKIKSQLEILKEKCQHFSQSIQQGFMELSDLRKNMNEITDIVNKILKEHADFISHVIRKTG